MPPTWTFYFDRPFTRHSSRASLAEVAAAVLPAAAVLSPVARVSSSFPSPNTSRFGEQWPPCPLPPELPLRLPPADPAPALASDWPIASRSPCLFPRFVSRLDVLSRWIACSACCLCDWLGYGRCYQGGGIVSVFAMSLLLLSEWLDFFSLVCGWF